MKVSKVKVDQIQDWSPSYRSHIEWVQSVMSYLPSKVK